MELTPRKNAEIWAKMAYYNLNPNKLAPYMDMTQKTLLNKLHGVTDWKLSECERIALLLREPMENLFPRK